MFKRLTNKDLRVLIITGKFGFGVLFCGDVINFKAVRMDGINTNLHKKWYFHKIV
jgi:hypothetical protein